MYEGDIGLACTLSSNVNSPAWHPNCYSSSGMDNSLNDEDVAGPSSGHNVASSQPFPWISMPFGQSSTLESIETEHNFEAQNDLDKSSLQYDGLTGEAVRMINVYDEYGVYGQSTQANPAEVSRFKEISQADIEASLKNAECAATVRVTKWAINVFEAWRHAYNENHIGEYVPSLSEFAQNQVVEYLPLFFFSARKMDGTEYPPSSLYSLACGIYRGFKTVKKYELNFLNEKKTEFAAVRNALDAGMKELTQLKIRIHAKHAEPILPESEKKLWEKGELGLGSGQSLLQTVFFYNCKLFGMRGRDEHRNLSVNDFKFDETDDGLRIKFEGGRCKNYTGGLKQRKINPKAITHISPHGSDPCIVKIFQAYIRAIGNTDPFYRRALCNKGQDSARFSKQPLGVHTLGQLMKKICLGAGLPGNFTNHPGKHTAATQLHQEGIDEQLICARTGHRSAAVRTYKRPSVNQKIAVSQILGPPQLKHNESEEEESEIAKLTTDCTSAHEKSIILVGRKSSEQHTGKYQKMNLEERPPQVAQQIPDFDNTNSEGPVIPNQEQYLPRAENSTIPQYQDIPYHSNVQQTNSSMFPAPHRHSQPFPNAVFHGATIHIHYH